MGGPTPATMGFAEVAVDSPTAPGRTFSYSIPDGLRVGSGHLVRVPFGRRTLGGLVMSLAEAPQVTETRPILSTTGDGPVLGAVQLRLARWISEYYISSLFEAAALMLPPGQRLRQRTRLSVGATSAEGQVRLSPLQAQIVDYVRRNGSVDIERLVRSMGESARGSASRLVEGASWNGWKAGAPPEPAPSSLNTQGCLQAVSRPPGTGHRRPPGRLSRLLFSRSSPKAQSLCVSATPGDSTVQAR